MQNLDELSLNFRKFCKNTLTNIFYFALVSQNREEEVKNDEEKWIHQFNYFIRFCLATFLWRWKPGFTWQ